MRPMASAPRMQHEKYSSNVLHGDLYGAYHAPWSGCYEFRRYLARLFYAFNMIGGPLERGGVIISVGKDHKNV